MNLPPGFVLGAATSAYQIEGAVAEDGRGPSIWDMFSHLPGRTRDGGTGDVAADHYHRWRSDVALMRELGLQAYRFSISWPRVQPAGRGALNDAGLAFYRELIDELAGAGIRPSVTLYHWDLPQALQDEGGWASRGTAHAFAEYARAMAREFGDRVWLWTTMDEPWCAAFLGHASGEHAPGHTDPGEALAVAHHLTLAHGLAVAAIREERPAAQVSVTLNLHVTRPRDESDSTHLEAVRTIDLVGNHLFLGPMLDGSYPVDLIAATRHLTDWSFVHEGDLTLTRQRLDVLGVSHRTTSVVQPGAGVVPGRPSPWVGAERVSVVAMEADPGGLRDVLTALGFVYPDLPLLVTVGGAGFGDVVEDDGSTVQDIGRRDHLAARLAVIEQAIADGVDVRGFFPALLDGFEWAKGYTEPSGIVRVDRATLERSVKESGWWYAALLARHRAAAPEPSPEPATEKPGFVARLLRRRRR